MASKGFFNAFQDIWILDGVRTTMVHYCGAVGHISTTDQGNTAAPMMPLWWSAPSA
jgi:acetyl-CoA C-acetyltransferase